MNLYAPKYCQTNRHATLMIVMMMTCLVLSGSLTLNQGLKFLKKKGSFENVLVHKWQRVSLR